MKQNLCHLFLVFVLDNIFLLSDGRIDHEGHTSVCQAPTILTLALLHPDSDYIGMLQLREYLRCSWVFSLLFVLQLCIQESYFCNACV